MEPLISVIVPVYNAEKYLDICIESILNQTYTNLEIIVVDDGSTDKSGVLCDKYAEKDERIIVYHQDNQGVSAARNWALDHVHGEYLIFVDSDDMISTHLVEMCLQVATSHQADIVVFRVQKVLSNSTHLENRTEVLVNNNETSESIRKKVLINKISNYLVTGFYKSNLWKDIRLPAYSSHEDMYSLPKIFVKARNLICIDNILYYYNRMNPDSLSAESAMFDVRKRYYKYKAYEEHRYWGTVLADKEIYEWAVFHMMWDAIKIFYIHFFSLKKLTTDELNEILQFMNNNWTSDMRRKLGYKMSILRWSALNCPYLCQVYGYVRYKQELIKRWLKY